jgi:hypothetical protein
LAQESRWRKSDLALSLISLPSSRFLVNSRRASLDSDGMSPASPPSERLRTHEIVPKQDEAFDIGTGGRAMKLASSRELYAYWSGLRGSRSAPERAEIDPVAIRGLLADTFILEIDRSAGYPFRVAGARTSALFLSELRGRAFLDIWEKACRDEVDEMLTIVTDEASPIVAGALAKPARFQAVELELLILPLRHRGATHSRAIGLFAPAAAPNWLGLAPAAPMALQSMRVLRRGDDRAGLAAARENEPASSQLEGLARLVRRGHFQFFSIADRRS